MATTLVDELIQKLGQMPRHRARRVVTRSGWRVRGITPPLRFQAPLSWESDIEHRLIYRLLTSWQTTDACTQSVRLAIPALTSDSPATIDYTPDALTKDRAGALTCIECKPAAQLADPELRRRHRDIKLFLNSCGVRFVEVTDLDLADAIPHENAKQLMRGVQFYGVNACTAALRDQVAPRLPCSLDALIAHVGLGPARAALFFGFGYFDMHRPLIGSTQISTHCEDHFDAAHFIYA